MKQNIQTLPIASIRRDSGAQFRVDGLSQTHVANLADAIENGAKLPPIVVFFDGALYWMADGDHRIEAHIVKHLEEITADVREGGQLDAKRFGRGANADHGLPRSVKTKRAAVEDALRDPDWASWSNVAIAKECHVSHEFVRQMRNDLSLTSNVGSEGVTYRDKHGNVSTMKTGKIGAKKETPTSPRREMIDLDKITFIEDTPEFQAEFPLSILTDAGVVLDGAQEWRGINREALDIEEPDSTVPLMVSIWPEGFPGFYRVSVYWGGFEEVSENREPEHANMLVCRLVGLGVPLEMLRQFRWQGVPAQDYSAEVRTRLGTLSVRGRRAMHNVIQGCAEIGRSFMDVRDELKDNTEEGTRFEDWVQDTEGADTTLEYAEAVIAFAERYQRSEDAWERGDIGEKEGPLVEAVLETYGNLGRRDEDGKLCIAAPANFKSTSDAFESVA